MAQTWTPSQLLAMQLRGTDILVSAAAGSGKTATLTERIIRSLTERHPDGSPVGDISRMLIVTFTRAAAAELRSRISAALSAAIAEHPEDRYLYRQLVALGSAHICTIDSFYLEPVRANFERLGLPATFRLADEAELRPLKEEILNRLIENHYRTASSHSDSAEGDPFASLRDNPFSAAMDDLMPNRDRGDTAQLLLGLFEKLVAFPEGLSLLSSHADRLEREASLPLPETTEGKQIAEALTRELLCYREDLREACETMRADPLTEEKYYPSFRADLDTAEHLLDALRNGQWEKAGLQLSAYSPLRLGTIKGGAEQFPEAERHKERRRDIIAALREIHRLYFSDQPTDYAAQMRQTARTERELYRLLTEYDAAVEEEKKRRAVLDFSDVRRYLLRLLLDGNGNPTDIARAYQERFDAIYIDEYQDVDTVQDRIFATLGAGGKRFMVGDIKQSIYSFRGAEPSIFAGYRKNFSRPSEGKERNDTGTCLFMSENFRCDMPVIATTNAICGYAFSVCQDSLGYRREDDLVCAKTLPPNAGPVVPVQLILLETPPRDQRTEAPFGEQTLNPEAVYISDEIHRLLSGECKDDGSPIRPQDIAILMRSMGMAGDLVKALRIHGIETTYAARDRLNTHPDMIFAVNLLSVIDNPREDVPLSTLLGDPQFPYPFSLAECIGLRRAAPDGKTLYDALCSCAKEAPSDASAPADTQTCVAGDEKTVSSAPSALSERCRAFLSWLEHWRDLAAALPIDRLLRKLLGEPFLAPKTSSPALLALYDAARHYQNSSFCGLYQFLRYFRKQLEDPDAISAAGLQKEDNAVHILSIHKSKGLEFPVVFLCGCASSFNREDLHSPLMFNPTFGAAARLFLADDASSRESLTRRAIALSLDEKQTEEEMRILYVALTRARERLYMTARLRGEAEPLLRRAADAKPGERFRVMSAVCYLDWILEALSPSCSPLPNHILECHILNRENFRRPHTSPGLLPNVSVQSQTKANVHSQSEYYHRILEDHRHYVDPRAVLRQLPTKAAASKLRRGMLDHQIQPEDFGDEDTQSLSPSPIRPGDWNVEDSAERIRQRIALMSSGRHSFADMLLRRDQASAAERGTAIHLFLQYCDYARIAANGVEAELTYLTGQHFLPSRAAEIIDRKQLEKFCHSELYTLASSAHRVWRELRFNRFLPYARLTEHPDRKKALGDWTLYVQGSIDLILEMPDQSLILCDYKTDRLPREFYTSQKEEAVRQALLAHYLDQLCIYTEATEGMFGRKPDRILFYSLPLGHTLDVTGAVASAISDMIHPD